jgi:outer membrane protein assembly factor BamB
MKKLLMVAVVVLACAHGVASADWPQLQCDPQRTGRNREALTIGVDARIRLLWEHRFWPEKVNDAVQPVIADGRVFVASREGTVYCLAAESGEVLWARKGFGPILSSAVSAGHNRRLPVRVGRCG